MSSSFSVDGKEIVVRLIKYLLEGSMVAVAAALIPKKTPDLQEILLIALIAAATFSLLDLFAPSITANSARAGVGLGLGASIVGWPGNVMAR